MQKVINYIKRCGGELITENERSHYFLLNKKVIRVSDHIGLNSDGNMNIIVTPTNYLVWNRTTGDIDVVDYEDIKAFIRHANLLCAVSKCLKDAYDVVLKVKDNVLYVENHHHDGTNYFEIRLVNADNYDKLLYWDDNTDGDLGDFVNNPNNFNTIYWNYFGLA